jgi:sulfate adenylyltransferase
MLPIPTGDGDGVGDVRARLSSRPSRPSRPSRLSRGAVVFFTGLSGSGKTTIAKALVEALGAGARDVAREVVVIDGDEIRKHLSADLGFDADSRARNVERAATLAADVAGRGGVAVTSLIAPFAAGRARARELVEPHGAFILVHVSTPLEVCEARDVKGLYARARAGEIADFTGISSPYEEPVDADVVIDTTTTEVAEAVRLVREVLDRRLDAR